MMYGTKQGYVHITEIHVRDYRRTVSEKFRMTVGHHTINTGTGETGNNA